MSKNRAWKHRPLRRDGGDAFLPDPASGIFIASSEAESAAEEFIASVTSADYILEDARNDLSIEEFGGPFVDEDELELLRE